jgi:hypothetical protein
MYMMKLLIMPLAALMLMMTAVGQVKAQDEGENSECNTVQADDELAEGWLIETCSNGETAYISPSGERCYANQGAVDTTACGDEVNNPNRIQVD